MSELRVRAFTVTDEGGEGEAVIVFEKHGAAARRNGASQLNTEWEYVSCRRTPWADQYIETGRVPDLAKIDMGWWITCHGCECRVDNSGEVYDYISGKERKLNPVEDERGLFCTPGCRTRSVADHEARKRAESRTLDRLIAALQAAMPGARFVPDDHRGWRRGHAYVVRDKKTNRYRAEQASIAFDFPGKKVGLAHLRIDKCNPKPYATCCSGDHDAFMAWRAAGYPAAEPAEWLNGIEQFGYEEQSSL